MTGGVYLIGTPYGPKKIGFTGHFRNRLATIRHYSPYPVFLLEEWPMGSVEAFAVEHTAHAMLWPHLLRGGWFNVSISTAGHAIDCAVDLVAGRSWREVLAGLGMPDCEHAMGKAMTMAGLANARKEGRIGGRRSKYSDEEVLDAARLGTKPGARKLGMTPTGFLRRLAKAKENQRV